jgi:hypothetical protein
MNISVHQRTYRAEDAFVDLIVGDLEDLEVFMVGVLVESLDPLESLGLLVFLLTLGPLDNFRLGDLELFVVGDLVDLDLRFLAMAVAQTRAKRRKRVLRKFIVICCSMKLNFQVHEKLQVCKIVRNERAFKSFGFAPRNLRRRGGKPHAIVVSSLLFPYTTIGKTS